MPGPNFGYSFEPTMESADRARRGGVPGAAPQGAIQTLNFRLPRVTGAASLSPLTGQDRVGTNFGGAVLQSVLKTVLGPQAASFLGDQGGGIGGADRRTARDSGSDVLAMLSRGGQGMPDQMGGGPSLRRPDPVIIPAQETGEGPSQPFPVPPPFRDPRPSLPDVPTEPAFDPFAEEPRVPGQLTWLSGGDYAD